MADKIAHPQTLLVAAKITHLVEAENLRLIDSGVDGVDPFDIGEIILNASIAALVRTFRSFEIGDDEELVTALRAGLRQ
jgi:hypothetical protein